MITPEQAAPQVARLSVFSNFPVLPEGRAELVKTVARISLTPAHAEAIADCALSQCRFSPVPAELTEIARELSASFRPPNPQGCKHCTGGWLPALYLVTWQDHKATAERITKKQAVALRDKLAVNRQMVYSGVQPCTCEAGKHQEALNASYAAYIREKGEGGKPGKLAKVHQQAVITQ